MKKLFTFIYIFAVAAIAANTLSAQSKTFKLGQWTEIQNSIVRELNRSYVDSLPVDRIMKAGIDAMLEELDPYTIYIPEEENEDFQMMISNTYGGIGAIIKKAKGGNVIINEPYFGSPAHKAGLSCGDEIMEINGEVTTDFTASESSSRMKGKPGTTVVFKVKKVRTNDTVSVSIVRERIHLPDVEYAAMINDTTGYILQGGFTENVSSEIRKKVLEMKEQGMKRLVLDLRGNGGGWMGIALQMANEFLHKGDMIVYTEGKNHPKVVEYANGQGNFMETPLVVLTDETSASASEIFAGTIQDNDRGTIIGRRTFGKGLVQQPFEFSDGSAVRLTIARYYTPSGRCIQKPYEKGDDKNYEMDIVNRYERGEFFSQDSIHQNDSLVYKTRLGRTVYGGGGIMPDIFVSSDTTDVTSYFSQAVSRRLIMQYCLRYSDSHRKELSGYTTWEQMLKYLQTQPLLDDFVAYAENKGLKRRYNSIMKSRKLIERSIYSNIIYDILGMLEHVKYINTFDLTVQKAIEVLEEGKAFPTPPEENN